MNIATKVVLVNPETAHYPEETFDFDGRVFNQGVTHDGHFLVDVATGNQIAVIVEWSDAGFQWSPIPARGPFTAMKSYSVVHFVGHNGND